MRALYLQVFAEFALYSSLLGLVEARAVSNMVLAPRNPKTGKKQQSKAKKQGPRARADKVVAQGTGRAVTKALGNSRGAALAAWDAFSPVHLALPRAIGPYATVRTTRVFTSTDLVSIFGTFRNGTFGAQDWNQWTNTVCVAQQLAGPVNQANGAKHYTAPLPGSTAGGTLTCVPSAISVQIINGQALQTTTGIVFGAVCSTQLALAGTAGTWSGLSDHLVSFMKPRLMSAGKLALRGVQLDSYPLNMSDCAEFTAPVEDTDAVFTWTATAGAGRAFTPSGWAPFAVLNPDAVPLTFLVTVEWRTRFDMANPAVSSHVHHPVASDQLWDKLTSHAVALGHGVKDIATIVASAGEAAAAVSGFASAVM